MSAKSMPPSQPKARKERPAAPPPAQRVACQEVEFRFQAKPQSRIFLAGSFNNWSAASHPLHPTAEGHFATRLALPTGRHEYKFVVDGQWHVDPQCPQQAANHYGSANSVIVIS